MFRSMAAIGCIKTIVNSGGDLMAAKISLWLAAVLAGCWQAHAGNSPAQSVNASATAAGGLRVGSVTNGTCSPVHTFACKDPNMDALRQPILGLLPQASVTPEPESLAVAVIAGLALARLKRRERN
jgi:hypothetical protein